MIMVDAEVPCYTLADFCQGHGAECPGDPGYCDDDHGVRSYCDGSCESARFEHLRYLREIGQPPVPTTDHITLELSGPGSSYVVRFDGPQAETWALDYIAARSSTHAAYDVMWTPFSYDQFPTLAEWLHPTCVHGLSEALCEDPINHWSDRD